jgi:eukaryotic-like serine/threonine-protein kinase
MSLVGSQVGRFHLLQLLGRGGMGEVYLAQDEQLGRQVAIKVIQSEHLDPDATRLFQREARAIANLNHPHILPLFDFGEATIHGTTLTYMVMPFCTEGTLVAWMQRRGNTALLSLQDVAFIVQQAASALQYAHNHQIVHQDVKPSNFLIRSSDDASGRPDLMLADFGVSKSTSATATVSQSVRGTPAYMAPEQWDGTPVPATDQYALAILAYDLLTGHPPFQGTLGQVMYQHIHVTPQPPGKINPRIPADVDTVLLHALAKKPEERFASISAFARAFEQALLVSSSSLMREDAQYEPLRNDMHAAVISVTPPEEQAHQFNANDATATSSDPMIGSKVAAGITPPYPSVTPEIRARRGLPRSTAILLVGLALLVVLGSAGFFLITKSNQQNPSTSTSSSPTSSAQQIPYPPFGAIALEDPLNDNSNGYNWLDSGGGAGFCTFKQGAYHVSDLQQGSNHFCLPNASFTDFAYQVQMTIIKGDVGGIAFRADKVKENGYLFLIGQDGKYRLYIFTNASSTVLRSGSSNSINKGLNQTNTVAVVANGSTIDLYVNNHKIDSVTNSTYSQGLIGVTATELNNPTEVVFSNAKVWT